MHRAGLLTLLLLIGIILSCSTTYYVRAFRVSTVVDSSYTWEGAPHEVYEGPIGEIGGWDLAIRMISYYETNDKADLSRDSFEVTITAMSGSARLPAPLVDSLTVAITSDTAILPLLRVITDSVSFEDAIKRFYRFGSVRISHDVDTVGVWFTADAPGRAVPEGRVFSVTMIRYEKKFDKVGARPKGW